MNTVDNFQARSNHLVNQSKKLNEEICQEIVNLCRAHPDVIVYGSKNPLQRTMGNYVNSCPQVLTYQTIKTNLKTLERILKQIK